MYDEVAWGREGGLGGIMPFKHDKFVEKVKARNAEHLEQDEQVEHAVGGQTGPIHSSPIFALVDVARRLTGQLQSRLIVLTDRNLYVAYPGFFGQFEMKELKAKYPRSEAAAHLTGLAKGLIVEVNGERVHFALGSMKHVRGLVEAASGGSAESAD
jgi:hypothetical protein